APIAGIALVSSWIGYEVGLIKDSISTLKELADAGTISAAPEYEAYLMWLNAVPYHFYSILAIILVFVVVLTRRHYGPMLQAEWRALKEGKVIRDGATPLLPTEEVLGAEPTSKKQASGWLFAIAMIVLVLVTLLGMWVTGAEKPSVFWETSFTDALMNADTAKALFWAGMATYLVTFAWVLLGRIMSFRDVMRHTIRGMYLMVLPNTILLHAWCIKSATDAVGTAEYVIHGAVVVGLSVFLVPLIIYLVSMFVSFTTGTSWGTFGVMMPMAVPMAWQLALLQYPDNVGIAYVVTFASIGAVFGGGIFGDHCSPISDTTIMSSMFSASDHIDHVSTQLPYALTAGLIG
ncbi:MAG: Na+/H+ antiporter NhaC family protein, partial [Zestosphaera sp.]